MCGITGIWNKRLSADELDNRVKESMSLLEHRGPDDAGIWQDSEIGLSFGHRRLSIIDTTKNAHQPMVHASGKYVLVFNGEIYNYQHLYLKYLNKAKKEINVGDTAVLLEILVKMGVNALELLNGMFAFAFFDYKNNEILLARDRFGEKPLYWFKNNEQFVFSSEISSIKPVLGNKTLDINLKALSVYHMTGSIPAPLTIYSNINSLVPGSYLQFKMGNEPTVKKYWSIDKSLKYSTYQSSNEQNTISIKQSFSNAIASCMVSDVPVGVFLSGGIDSNSILATTASEGLTPNIGLCVDFPEKKYSEYSIAKCSADKYGIELVRYVVDESIFEEKIASFFSVMDQPTIDGFNTYFVSNAARESGIKVWLSGVGGDELFGGYPSFDRMKYLLKIIPILQILFPDKLATKLSGLRLPIKLAKILSSLSRGSPSIRAYQLNRLIMPPVQISRALINAMEISPKELQLSLDEYYPVISDDYDYF